MTRIGPTDVVMPTYGRAADGPVSALIAFRAPGSACRTSCEPTSARPEFPRVASVKPACGRLADRFRPACPRSRCPRVGEQHFPASPAQRPYPHPLRRRAAALYGCPVDPGRDMLCTLNSPPRRLQWP
jgi:hypothetical protein